MLLYSDHEHRTYVCRHTASCYDKGIPFLKTCMSPAMHQTKTITSSTLLRNKPYRCYRTQVLLLFACGYSTQYLSQDGY